MSEWVNEALGDLADGIKYVSDKTDEVIEAILGDAANPNGPELVQGETRKEVGVQAKTSAAKRANEVPALIVTKGTKAQAPVFTYPEGLTRINDSEYGPFLEILAFKYQRNPDSTKTFHLNVDQTPNLNLTELLYVARFPLPGNITSRIGARLQDVSNTVAKISNVDFEAAARDTSKIFQDIGGVDPAQIKKLSKIGAISGVLAALKGGNAVHAAGSAMIDQASLTLGKSINPAVEVSYVLPEMNTHQFDFTLVPRSSKENEAIESMLYHMRGYALPQEHANLQGVILEYPALHEIRFCAAGGEPIPGMSQIPDSFLESVSVTFNPFGTGRLMDDGRPASYRLSLSFKEIKTMTRDGYRVLYQYNKGSTL